MTRPNINPPQDIFEVYKHLRDFEADFNRLQDGLKKMASGWLLATFAGVGYSYKTNPEEYYFLVDNAVLAVVVCLLGAVGIFVLWILDQMVYQNLLRGAFLEGCRMEKENPTLPQVRRLMMYVSQHQGMGRYLQLFYAIPLVILTLLIGAITLADTDVHTALMIITPLICFFISTTMAIIILRKSSPDYKKLAQGIYSRELEEWYGSKG